MRRRTVTNEPLHWLEAIFADVQNRAPFAMDWTVDRRELPMIVTVTTPRADSRRRLIFDGDDTVLGRSALRAASKYFSSPSSVSRFRHVPFTAALSNRKRSPVRLSGDVPQTTLPAP